jgi:hypothetical protein
MKFENSFAERAIAFFQSLHLELPSEMGIEVMNPYQQPPVALAVSKFYLKYFNDQRKRIFMMGINPGRFGGGISGISFTDPVALRDFCGIENSFGNKRELSSEFIYRVIEKYGGPKKFYQDFFMSAVCPLGFMKGTLNYNYYDDKRLQEAVLPFIRTTFRQQVQIGARTGALICIGTNKNYRFLEALNSETGLFKKIIPVEHPRFIMQYRRKKLEEYIDQYLAALTQAVQTSS